MPMYVNQLIYQDFGHASGPPKGKPHWNNEVEAWREGWPKPRKLKEDQVEDHQIPKTDSIKIFMGCQD